MDGGWLDASRLHWLAPSRSKWSLALGSSRTDTAGRHVVGRVEFARMDPSLRAVSS